jgi:hypothetical protein
MKTRSVFASALIIVTASVCAAGQTKRAPRRIVFARGTTVARASGYMRHMHDELWFVLRAVAGQHMRVEINGAGPTRGVVVFPSGKEDGGPGGIIFNDLIDETGDYKIRVTESSMANAWRGHFTVSVEILPRGQRRAGSSDLEKYVGKYPSELFRDVPAVKSRLRDLLGASYKAFFDRMQVQTPIEKEDEALVMRGCMKHLCTIEESILVIDLNDGTPYVALKRDSKINRTFPANRSLLPEALKRAMEAH